MRLDAASRTRRGDLRAAATTHQKQPTRVEMGRRFWWRFFWFRKMRPWLGGGETEKCSGSARKKSIRPEAAERVRSRRGAHFSIDVCKKCCKKSASLRFWRQSAPPSRKKRLLRWGILRFLWMVPFEDVSKAVFVLACVEVKRVYARISELLKCCVDFRFQGSVN